MPITLHPPPGAPPPDLAGKTLVVPAVAVGNVGQLACDLLITTLSLPSAAHALCPHLLPAVGRDAVDDGGVATEAQLYGDGASTFFILHVRSPPLPGRAADWQADVAALATAAGVARVLVLGSVDAAARRDAHLGGNDGRAPPVAVVGAASDPALLTAAGVPPLIDGEFDPPRAERRLPPWRLLGAAEAGGGEGGAPPTLALLAYATDGDNRADAAALATAAAGVLGVEAPAKGWAAPGAWGAAYGAAARVV